MTSELMMTTATLVIILAVGLTLLLRVPRPERRELQWMDVSCSLPPQWGIVAAGPSDRTVRPIHAPFAQAFVRAAVSVAPTLQTALEGGRLFRLIGPPEALKAMDAGALKFLNDKQGDMLGTLVKSQGGPFEHNARWESAAPSMQGAATAAALFQLLSIATAQYYLHQISAALQSIDSKVTDLVGHIEDARIGKLNAARDVLREVHEGCLRRFEANEGLESFKAPPEFWARMANAETQLREVIHETEAELRRKAAEWRAQLGSKNPDGSWTRESKGKVIETKALNDIRSWLERRMPVYTEAVGLMTKWYQVALAFDAFNDPDAARPRYAASIGFMSERRRTGLMLEGEHRFWLDAEGGVWTDLGSGWTIAAAGAVALAAGALAGPLGPFLGGAVGGWVAGTGAARDAKHKESKHGVLEVGNAVRHMSASFASMATASGSMSSQFFLMRSGPDGRLALCAPADHDRKLM